MTAAVAAAPGPAPARRDARVTAVVELGGDAFLLRLDGCAHLAGARPGQFAMLRGDWGRDPLLPRPMSVLRAGADGAAEFLLKEAGRGSRLFRHAGPGTSVSVLGPLGRPFPAPRADRRDLLIAGGVGLAPLLLQAEHAAAAGAAGAITFLYGARTAGDLVLLDRVRACGAQVALATEDGSAGTRGRVTDAPDFAAALAARDTVLACGPNPMLRAIHERALAAGAPCHLSLEGPMGCGIRTCLGCPVPGTGARPFLYLCSDGPVLDGREFSWP